MAETPWGLGLGFAGTALENYDENANNGLIGLRVAQVTDKLRADGVFNPMAWIGHPTLGPALMSGDQNNYESALAQIRGGPGGPGGSGSVDPGGFSSRAEARALAAEAEAKARRTNQMHAELNNLAGIFGLGGDWGDLARQAIENNWDLEQVRDMVADHISMATGDTPGLVQQVFARTRENAKQYYFNVDDGTLLNFAKRIAKGEMEEGAIDAWARDTAKNQYWWMADVIDSGVTLYDYFSPHRQEAAKYLEISTDGVDFMNDPTFAGVLGTRLDNGNVVPMTMTQVGQLARQSELWKTTNNANEFGNQMVTTLAKTLGAM